MKTLVTLLVVFALSPFSAVFANMEPRIDWQVVNRFPLFKDDVWFTRLAGIPGLGEQTTSSPVWPMGVTAESVMTSEQFYRRLREYLPRANETAWLQDEGLYDRTLLFRLENHIVGSSDVTADQCRWELWRREPATLVNQQVGSCEASPLLKVPDITQAYELRLSNTAGQLVSSTPVRIEQRLVVALGDSFASGEGNPDHPAEFSATTNRMLMHDWFVAHDNPAVLLQGKQAAWWDRACHRSLLSWPAMAALKRAVNERKVVVQFASFACSGAEIYDGFLKPQIEPPGFEYSKAIERVYLRQAAIHPSLRPSGQYKYRLRYSQLEALARLLCDGQVGSRVANHNSVLHQGVRKNQQPFYGPFNSPTCKGALRPVDQLLFMFGGNDTGFSGVVLQAVNPGKLKFQVSWAGDFINSGIAQILDPIYPRDAYQRAIVHLPELFRHVDLELRELNISPANVTLGTYPDLLPPAPPPDPLPGVLELFEKALAQCNLRTRDGFTPLQILLEQEANHGSAMFGLRTENRPLLDSIRHFYIGPLVDMQRRAAATAGWRTVDTNPAFAGRDICAVSPKCSGDQCPQGDRVRWAWSHVDIKLTTWDEAYCLANRDKAAEPSEGGGKTQTVSFCGAAPLRKISEFNPYDPTRSSGIRFATDALLAAANRERQAPHGRNFRERSYFSQDGIYGLGHPTAHMHSRIADFVQP